TPWRNRRIGLRGARAPLALQPGPQCPEAPKCSWPQEHAHRRRGFTDLGWFAAPCRAADEIAHLWVRGPVAVPPQIQRERLPVNLARNRGFQMLRVRNCASLLAGILCVSLGFARGEDDPRLRTDIDKALAERLYKESLARQGCKAAICDAARSKEAQSG